jgi:hypothetical protein
LAFQSAKGTIANDFTASGAKAVWCSGAEIDAGTDVESEEWADSSLGPPAGGQWVRPDRPAGTIPVMATPTSLEWLLVSNYGAYSAPTFSLATQIASDRWLTAAWVESVASGSTENLVRLRDLWFHRLDISGNGPQGRMMVEAQYAARAVAIQSLSGGGVTLPASPMSPSDKSPFPNAKIEIRRDPAGANVALRWRAFRLTLDQGLAHEWDPAAFAFDVWKRGRLRAGLEVLCDWSDETWTVLTNARAKTAQTYRVKATAEDGSILTVDLHNVIFSVDRTGRNGMEYAPFRAVGQAAVSGSNFVSLSLT